MLVSEESYTTFNPMLAEVVGASVFPEHVVAPIRQMLDASRGSQFIMGRVTAVDRDRRSRDARARWPACARSPTSTSCSRSAPARNLDLVPGLAQHALPLKLVGDAMFIRNRVLQRVARIELESDAQERARLGHFVVIGGGFSGVEVAGELEDFLRGARALLPARAAAASCASRCCRISTACCPSCPRRWARLPRDRWPARGIDVRLGARASEVDGRAACAVERRARWTPAP